jgi:hypothetical protein
MHWLRYVNRDDDHDRFGGVMAGQVNMSDHRVDAINRTRACECDECMSARNRGQPELDHSIIEQEHEWFRQDETDDHGHLARHPSDEFEPSAVSSSAGAGAGLSAVMTTQSGKSNSKSSSKSSGKSSGKSSSKSSSKSSGTTQRPDDPLLRSELFHRARTQRHSSSAGSSANLDSTCSTEAGRSKHLSFKNNPKFSVPKIIRLKVIGN